MMRWLISGTLLLIAALATMVPTVAGDGPWLPLHAGAEWTYAVSGPRPHTMKIRVSGPVKDGAWPLVVDGVDTKARLSDDGVRLLQIRHVGVAARPVLTLVSDLRWSGADSWQGQTASGCLVTNLLGHREGTETIEVPAGRFECVKITNKGISDDTWWLARGVGIVKRIEAYPQTRIEWTLQSRH